MRHPDPTEADTLAVLDAIAALPDIPESAPLPTAGSLLGDAMRGWAKLAASDRLRGLPDLARDRLVELTELEGYIVGLSAGGALVHLDMLSSNVDIDDEGGVTFTGWQFASRGSRFFDAVSYLFDLAGRMPHGALDAFAASHPVLADHPADDVDAVLAGLVGWSFNGDHEQWGRDGLAWLAARRRWS